MREVIERARGLRRRFGVDPGNVAGERIGRVGIVGYRVPQERIEIAYRGESEPVHRRIFRGIREFVDIVGDEVPCRQLDRCVRWTGVCPAAGRDGLRGVVQVHAVRQLCIRLAPRSGGIGQRIGSARTDNVLVPGSRNRRAVGIRRNRQVCRRRPDLGEDAW